jgi:superfamily II DNA helicase RecQ
MQIKIFTVRLIDSEDLLIEMNRFLASKKIMEIEQQFFNNEKEAYWTFCVRYIENSTSLFEKASTKQKVDYRSVLNERDFLVFSKLRECRKIIAVNQAVPAYAVFTDEELSEISKLPELNHVNLVSIKGIGDKKIEKYGNTLIDLYFLNSPNN